MYVTVQLLKLNNNMKIIYILYINTTLYYRVLYILTFQHANLGNIRHKFRITKRLVVAQVTVEARRVDEEAL